MQERNIIGGVTASVLSPFIEGWQQMLEIKRYVAANSSMHDYGASGRTKAEILKDAKLFWFHDEDMTADNKVYWYFKDEIFK